MTFNYPPSTAFTDVQRYGALLVLARFTVLQNGKVVGSPYEANLSTGTITIDRAAKTGSVDVSIDAKSVNTGSEQFNEHIQGEDFLSTAKFPTITFKSTAVKFNGDAVASVDGALTIKGVTKPVTLTVTSFKCMPHPMLKKEACGANATATIKRSDFGAGKYAPLVADEVLLTIPIEAIKQ